MVRNTIGSKMKVLLVICLVALARTQDVMENNLFEGDMELSPQEIEKVYEGDGVDPNAPLAARVSGHWPGGIIAYTMSTDISSSARAVAAIDDAIKDYHQSTCLRFVKRTNEKAYINFVKGSGCSSPVGYRGSVNTINLASGCWYKGIVAHEIAHSLGFFHEQSRPDRDHYVKILWQNIQAGRSHNFQKRGSDVHSMNVPYDFKSLMHYRATSFGSGRITIDPHDPKMRSVIGQRAGLSDLDKLQMNLLYKCTGFTSPKPASLPPIPTTTIPITARPTPETNAAKAVNCPFDYGMCNWRNDAHYDQFDWSRIKGSTPSTGTGPSADHSGKGYYVFIETSSPRARGDVARLRTPLIAASSNSRCFNFYYHMYGSTMGSFSVYINYKLMNTSSRSLLLFKKNGQQGNVWLPGQADIPAQPYAFEIVLQGESGGPYTGDIAVDDVSITNGSCSKVVTTQRPTTRRQTTQPRTTQPRTTQPRTTQPRTTQPRTTQPKTTHSPPTGVDCTFDSGMCSSWSNVKGDQFDWTRHSGRTGSADTGPERDHSGTGYYMYIEASYPRKVGETAELQSRPLEDSCDDRCFTFYYHMYGQDIDKLSVSLRSNGQDTLLWELRGKQKDGWLQGTIPISKDAPQYARIVFTGVIGKSYQGDIAIDDIVMNKQSNCSIYPASATPRPIPPVTTQKPVVTTQKPVVTTPKPVITTQKPIVSSADCDFEQGGMCKWVNERSSDVFDWTRRAGSTPSSATGPSTDHTTGTSSGYYLYIETSSPRTTGHNAILKSASISGSSRPSCFGFWYHMYGATVNQLKVSIKTMAGANTVMWLLKGQQGSTWQRASVPIPASNGTFSIMMEGISGSSYTGDISIDDLNYVKRSCQLSPSNARPPTPTTPGPPTPPPPTLAPGSCGISPVPHSRVIGGKDAVVGAWPWQAALRTSSGRFFCGGSLINNQWILTAAHCIGSSSPSYYKITLGDHNRLANEGTEKDFTVSKVIKNPNYHQGASYNNDAALLKLSRPVLITKRISPVCLPLKSEVVAVGTKCYITGWGKIRHPGSSHTILQQAVMPIRSKKDCADRLAKSPYAGRLKITDQMVCAGNLGNSTIISGCHGDSGGPLVCQKPSGEFQLHGAVSWGSPKCSIQQLYTVFARITAVKDWIDRTVQQN